MTYTRLTRALAASAIAITASAAIAIAQSASTAAAPAPTAVQLQHEVNALDTMDKTIGPMVASAMARTKLMEGFISSQNLDAQFQDYASSADAPTFHAITFNQAYQQALGHQDLGPKPNPGASSADDLQSVVMATQTLVHKQWNRLNSLHDQVAKMHGFLTQQKKMEAYFEWAKTEEAKQSAAAAAQRKAVEARKREYNQKLDAALAKEKAEMKKDLQQNWDKAQHAMQQKAQQTGPGGQGTAYGPEGADADEGHYYDNGYYSGSYFNGYADPYYDVYGGYRGGAYGRGYAAGAGAEQGARNMQQYDRRHGAARADAVGQQTGAADETSQERQEGRQQRRAPRGR